MSSDIHKDQPVLYVGAESDEAKLFVILLHGRGSNAENMVFLAGSLEEHGVRFALPQAALNRWYPQMAFGPLEANEPDLSSALSKVDTLVKEAHNSGFSDEQIVFGGFSQGACLASEYVARNARKYGGLIVLSGALIGPPGMSRTYTGNLEEMPIFIGGSDVDPWVKHEWMREAADILKGLGGKVDFRTYPGMAHTVNEDELDASRNLLLSAMKNSTGP